MENKKISFWWAALIGLLIPLLQVAIFYFRFGRFNQESSLLDYVVFFLAAVVGGLILVAFLRGSKTNVMKWIVVIAFLLATPFAMFGMIGGGLLGPIGVVLFSAVIWGIITGLGFIIGRFFSR